jgi:hypothetical protein
MIQNPDVLREKLMEHSKKYPGTLKEIANRIGISYGAFLKFLQLHTKQISFETTCKINKYLDHYSDKTSSGPLSVRQTCELHNALRACHLGTLQTMHKLTDVMGLQDIREIDASRFEEAMRHLDLLGKKEKRCNNY